jgi:protein ImuB
MAMSTLNKTRGEIWLCLHFAQLALEVFGDRDPARPVAIIENQRVHCANRANLEPGLALTTAHALYPDLQALERQPVREAEWLDGLAHWAYQFTPMVVIDTDNCLLLEIGSCRQLYRGITPLLEQLRDTLQQRGHQCREGLAHTPKAAWLLAHYSSAPALRNEQIDKKSLRAHIDAVPAALLQIDTKKIDALQHMGINTLGAMRALPLAALGKRFGADSIRYLQQLWGRHPDPQVYFTPTPQFRQGLAFIDGIYDRNMLLFPMKRLIHALCDYLRARQLHCHTLRWQLFDAHRVQAEIHIELSRVQNDWRTLLELTQLQLDQVALSGAVFSIGLHSADFFTAAPVSENLFADAGDHLAAGHALLDRLRARLGSDALQQVQMQASLWPEHAAQTVALDNTHTAHSAAAENVAPQNPRPLWLLPKPQRLRERDGLLIWHSALTVLRGPERVDSHWWREQYNERDYYIARNGDGSLCWIFRDRTAQQWFLHGLFA